MTTSYELTRAAWLLAASLAARLPQAMLGIALIVHGDRVAGSLAAGGLAAGGFALGAGLGGPWWGRRADRYGAALTLLVSASLQTIVLVTTALLPVGIGTAPLVMCGVAAGLATPPLGACLRAALPRMIADQRVVRRAYGAEASALELTFIAGPALALGVAAASSSAVVLAGCALVLAAATTTYVALSRGLRVADPGSVPSGWQALRRGLRNRSLVAMTLVMGLVGIAFGTTEVGVIAVADHETGSHGAAGMLLALWGVGSLVAGALYTWRAPAPTSRLLTGQLWVFGLGHLALSLLAGDLTVLAVGLVLAGAAIAPTFATVHALAGQAVRESRATEAFAWIATATSCGSALGAAAGGALAEAHTAAALGLAGAAGLATVMAARYGQRRVVAVAAPAPTRPVRERDLELVA